jgi:hypothetical protein
MATIPIKTNEATAERRRVFFYCVDVTDGMTPETAEAGGQPQISIDGATWAGSGSISTLTAVGNGRYYATIVQSVINVANGVFLTRYKSANTAECIGDTAIVDSRLDGIQASCLAAIDSANFATTADFVTDAELTDFLLNRALSVGTDSGGRTVRNALRGLVNKVSISGGTLTVYKEDDTTSAYTAAVGTNVSQAPIVSIDPA